MFEAAFRQAFLQFATNGQLVTKYWTEVADHYNENGRYYHTLSHLEYMHGELLHIKQFIEDWPTLVLSIAYHDFIYDATKNDNEERSADEARLRLNTIGVSEARVTKCAFQIMATKGHKPTDDNDTNFFLDSDLAILGAPATEYEIYSTNIRKEYQFYSDNQYAQGRKAVIAHFLETDNIFKSHHFYERYEQQARQNLKREFSLL